MTDITLRQLKYFSVLSTALQYRRAARQLGISQPSLTLQIKALEETLGTRLVERRRSGLILTPQGRQTAVLAQKILRDVETLRHSGSAQSGLSGTLRLGSSPTIGPYFLPRVLRKLHVSHPELKLVIRDGPSKELSEDLLAGKHDLILTQLPIGADEIRWRPLFREPLYLAVSRDHPLADRDSAAQSDLAGESLLGLNPAYALSRQLSDLSMNAGARLRDDFEGTSLDALRQMVSLGMGATLLPALYVQSEVRQDSGDVAALALSPAMHRQVALAWRAASGNPRAYTRLADLMRNVVTREFAGCVSL